MQEQFTYRELSEKLDINLAKLKRWGREFLPPDYSAGQSQGVARILTIDEAFIIFLAGHLVSSLKYSIPETKVIMELIIPWLEEKKLMPSTFSIKDEAGNHWELMIYFNTENNTCLFTASGCLKTVLYKEKKEHHKNFSILKRRVAEEKIEETVSRHNDEQTKDFLANRKSLNIHFLCLSFFHRIIGFEFLKKLASEVENNKRVIISNQE